jgi:hypothetical protein
MNRPCDERLGEEAEDDGGVGECTDGGPSGRVFSELEAEKQDDLDGKEAAGADRPYLSARESEDAEPGGEERERYEDPEQCREVCVAWVTESKSEEFRPAVTQFVGDEYPGCCQGHLSRANSHAM